MLAFSGLGLDLGAAIDGTGLTHVAEGLGDHAVSRQILEIPLGRALCFPRPEDPAVSLLKSDELGFDKALDVRAVGIAEALDGASVFTIAGADVVRSLATLVVGAIVTGADTTTVEPLE